MSNRFSFPVERTRHEVRGATPVGGTLGDSRLGTSWANTPTKYAGGMIYWIEMLTQGRVRLPRRLARAVNGARTYDQFMGAAALAASDADFILYYCDLNDNNDRQNGAAGAITLAQSQANILSAINTLLAGGKRVIVFASSPKGPIGGFTGVCLQYHMAMVQWIKEAFSFRAGCVVIDPWPWLADMTSMAGNSREDMQPDGAHTGALGAYYNAIAVADILNTWYPAIDGLIASPADIYSVHNPHGALNSNPMFVGAGGLLGPNATGTVALDWQAFTNDPNLSVACSIVHNNGRNWQQMVISGTPTSSLPQVTLKSTNNYLANLNVGDDYEASCEIQVDAGATGVYTPYLEACTQGIATDITQSGVWGVPGHKDDYSPSMGYGGVIRTDPQRVSAGVRVANTSINVYAATGVPASMTLRVARLAKRRMN
jgi:hypothetical protein